MAPATECLSSQKIPQEAVPGQSSRPEPFAEADQPEDDGLSTASGSGCLESEEEEDAVCRPSRPEPPILTLFILDWDDTIMPTTWLHRSGCVKDVGEVTRHLASLMVASECVAQTLRSMRRLGRVVVVTNAEEGWVEQSIDRYMPQLWAVLSGVQAISARTRYEERAPGAPSEWKRLAFELVVGKFCQQLVPGQQANVVSIGDMLAERDALFSATEDAPDCWGKALKLHERPTLSHLVREHQLIQGSLGRIVSERGDLDLSCSDRSTDQL